MLGVSDCFSGEILWRGKLNRYISRGPRQYLEGPCSRPKQHGVGRRRIEEPRGGGRDRPEAPEADHDEVERGRDVCDHRQGPRVHALRQEGSGGEVGAGRRRRDCDPHCGQGHVAALQQEDQRPEALHGRPVEGEGQRDEGGVHRAPLAEPEQGQALVYCVSEDLILLSTAEPIFC